ncbi:cold-shock protein [Paenibacillus xanthanilyticus]|uniref:Cold-shock protein n=1 Tax=Paenibacillus xanthanilyticus TaxID=1783531 RepID=A0ABV8JUC8_9BACL
MYYSRKRPVEEVPVQDTAVWTCSNDDCNGWMRDDFAFAEQPCCPQCQSAMISAVKSLPVLVNTSPGKKSTTI